jgi:hypothetical protein
MCDAPRDLERKVEQRWAAKFTRPVRTATPEKPQLEARLHLLVDQPKPKESPAALKQRPELVDDVLNSAPRRDNERS